jgi:hypothetical protein
MPWFHVTAGGSTANGGWFHLGGTGDYPQRLTYDGADLVFDGTLYARDGDVGGWVIGDEYLASANGEVRLSSINGVQIVADGDWTNVQETNAVSWHDNATYANRIGWIYGALDGSESVIIVEAEGRELDYAAAIQVQSLGGTGKSGVARMGAYGGGVDTNGATFTLSATGVGGGATALIIADITGVASSSTRIGDGGATNYSQFDATGHLTFAGTAKPWQDMLIEPIARTTGTNAPTFEKWYDDAAGTSRGVYLYSFDDAAAGSEKEVFFNMQMSHAWDGGDVQFHVHWIGAVDDTTATPRWGLEYVWREPGGTYGDTTIVYATGNHLSEADIAANKHYITAFTALSPGSTADDLSSVLIGRLFRNSSNAADTYNATGAKCGLLYIDAHYQLARIGSNDEYSV